MNTRNVNIPDIDDLEAAVKEAFAAREKYKKYQQENQE